MLWVRIADKGKMLIEGSENRSIKYPLYMRLTLYKDIIIYKTEKVNE